MCSTCGESYHITGTTNMAAQCFNVSHVKVSLIWITMTHRAQCVIALHVKQLTYAQSYVRTYVYISTTLSRSLDKYILPGFLASGSMGKLVTPPVGQESFWGVTFETSLGGQSSSLAPLRIRQQKRPSMQVQYCLGDTE